MSRIDTNWDGYVTPKEFEIAVPMMKRWNVVVEQPKDVFKTIDVNGNGLVNFN